MFPRDFSLDGFSWLTSGHAAGPQPVTPSRLLKNYLRGHRGVKNRLKMLIYNA